MLQTHIQTSVAHMKMLETQIAQLIQQVNTRAPIQFQSKLKPKGKEPDQSVNAVTIRSGKQLVNPSFVKVSSENLVTDNAKPDNMLNDNVVDDTNATNTCDQ